MSDFARRSWLLPPIVALCLYLPSLASDFVFDDRFLIVENPIVHRGDPWEIARTSYWADRNPGQRLYRPGVIATYALDHALWGLRPLPYHGVNILLHALVTLLLTVLASVFGWRAGLVAGLLFAVHPALSEAVSLVAGRADLLAAAGAFGALCLHRMARPGRRHAGAAAVGALLAYAVSLTAKESAFLVPVVLVVWDVWIEPVPIRWSRVLAWGGYGLVAVFYLVARGLVLEGDLFEAGSVSPIDNPLALVAWRARLAGSATVFRHALSLLAWPATLSVDYSFDSLPLARKLSHPDVLVAGLAVLALVASGLGGLRWARGWAAGVTLFLAGYLPVSQWLFPTGTIFGERLLYLPAAGLCLALGALMSSAGRALGPRAGSGLVAVALVLAFAGALRTWLRLFELRTEEGAFAAAVREYPRSVKAWYNLAHVRLKQLRFDEAEEAIRRTQEIAGLDFPLAFVKAKTIRLARRLFVEAERDVTDPEGALADAERALRGNPEDAKALALKAKALLLLGEYETALEILERVIFLSPEDPANVERLEEALATYEAATLLEPANPRVWNRLGVVLLHLGRPAEAARRLETALALDPEFAEAEYHLGLARQRLGELEAAERHFRRSLAIDDSNATVHDGLGILLGQQERYAEAEASFLRALAIDPGHRDAIEHLLVTYERTGQTEKAAALRRRD